MYLEGPGNVVLGEEEAAEEEGGKPAVDKRKNANQRVHEGHAQGLQTRQSRSGRQTEMELA